MKTILIFLGVICVVYTVIFTIECVCFIVDVTHTLFFRKKKVRNYKAIC